MTRRRWLLAITGLGMLALAVAVGVGLRARRPTTDAAQQLFARTLPHWQVVRAQALARGGTPATDTAELSTAAQRWPGVAQALARLTAAWPDEASTRAAVADLNAGLHAAALPYFADVQMVQGRPMVLTYTVEARVPWAAGEGRVQVLRLRRLDRLNIEMAMLGETEGSQPLVLMDRLEATLASDLPTAFSDGVSAGRTAGTQDEVERIALAQLRRLLEVAGGPALGATVHKLVLRDRRVEAMRNRLHQGKVQLALPDGFVLGDDWFEGLTPYTDLRRPGGPLILNTDLRAASDADEALRTPEATAALGRALDFMARATEAHEAHHALANADKTVLPPPGPLLSLMEGSEVRFQTLAEHELRAYMGELSDSPSPVCLSLLKLARASLGRRARATPHFYAGRIIFMRLAQLIAPKTGELVPTSPAVLLDRLCAMSDSDVRAKLADVWMWLYGVPRAAAVRQSS